MRTLLSYATFRMAGIRGMVFSADASDLLHEAIARTLDGRRRWNHERIDFVTHLKGCMRSIASELLQRATTEIGAIKEAAMRSWRQDLDEYWPTEILEHIPSRLADDELALQVFERLRQGYTRAEIIHALKMRPDAYDAARKRISRALYAVAQEEGVQTLYDRHA